MCTYSYDFNSGHESSQFSEFGIQYYSHSLVDLASESYTIVSQYVLARTSWPCHVACSPVIRRPRLTIVTNAASGQAVNLPTIVAGRMLIICSTDGDGDDTAIFTFATIYKDGASVASPVVAPFTCMKLLGIDSSTVIVI